LGTQRRTGFEGLRPASIAEHVTQHATCPVLCVPVS
jgi:nucleotide-binding universal stress UspA family protein